MEEGGVTLVAFFAWVRKKKSGGKFIAPSQGLIIIPSTTPGTTGDWAGKICIPFRSMNSRLRLQSVHWPIHVRVKWVPKVFLPGFDSKSWVWLETIYRAWYLLIKQTEIYFLLLVAVITLIILLLIIPTIQDIIHWLILAGIRVSVSKSDLSYGVSLDFPQAPDDNITSCLQ